jgi:hypothetical protein
MNFNSTARWQIKSNLAVLGGFNIANSESNDAAFSRKNFIFNKINLAGEYLFVNEIWMRWFARLGYIQPFEKIDYAGDTVLTSDAATEINPEIILNLDFEDGIYSFIKGGLIVRGNGLSTLATYGAGSELRFSDYGFGAAVLGELSIKEDEYTQRASYRDNLNNRVNAGSKIFNSINHNSHNLEFNFNFLISQLTLFKLYTGFNLLGSNVSSGYYAGVNVNWMFDLKSTKSKSESKIDNKFKESDLIFKENTNDGVNQDYFKPLSTTPNLKLDTKEPVRVELDTTPTPIGKKNVMPKQYKIKLRKKVKKDEQ